MSTAPLMHSRIRVDNLNLVAILVDGSKTYSVPGTALIVEATPYFPTLPIILVSPRIGGFSRSFAHFDTTNIINHINADEIEWRPAVLPEPSYQLPF